MYSLRPVEWAICFSDSLSSSDERFTKVEHDSIRYSQMIDLWVSVTEYISVVRVNVPVVSTLKYG